MASRMKSGLAAAGGLGLMTLISGVEAWRRGGVEAWIAVADDGDGGGR
jgi:hypothetical protein